MSMYMGETHEMGQAVNKIGYMECIWWNGGLTVCEQIGKI